MNFYIDAGNSNIKCMIEEIEGRRNVIFPRHNYESGLKNMLNQYTNVGRILVSSVLGSEFKRWLIQYCDKSGLVQPEFIEVVDRKYGVTLGYDHPEQLGVDRFLALVAARGLYGKTVIVIDAGTALTIDCMMENGVHKGGVIIPGLMLVMNSLQTGTSRINALSRGVENVFSTNTADAVYTGARYAIRAGVEAVLSDMISTLKSTPLVVLTGGGRASVQLDQSYQSVTHENLVIEGLKIVAQIK